MGDYGDEAVAIGVVLDAGDERRARQGLDLFEVVFQVVEVYLESGGEPFDSPPDLLGR